MSKHTFNYNDGGRSLAGFTGMVSDCVTRAIAIATQENYTAVWTTINRLALDANEKTPRQRTNKPLADKGIYPSVYHQHLESLGWKRHSNTDSWNMPKRIKLGDLPMGVVIVQMRGHLVCIIDQIVQDTFDSFQRARTVLNYWTMPTEASDQSAPSKDNQIIDTYHAPTMPYNALYTALCCMTRPTVKHSKRLPVTTVTPGRGQSRVVVYKVVKAYTLTLMDSSWGLRYGSIRLNGDQRIVKSTMQVNGAWSQWELL